MCLLLLGLWVRSYDLVFEVYWPIAGRDVLVQSNEGSITVYTFPRSLDPLEQYDAGSEHVFFPQAKREHFPSTTGKVPMLNVRHWQLMAVIATVCIAPWIPKRFSLRTLLFFTTLVALVLGLVVYFSKK